MPAPLNLCKAVGHMAILHSCLILPSTLPCPTTVLPLLLPCILALCQFIQLRNCRREINRVYAHDITYFSIHNKVTIALQQQILTAVNPTYLQALEDPDCGFLQVTPCDMVNHLVTHYGTLTPQELEANRLSLSTAWNPDAPIEDLWGSVANICCVASAGQSPIADISVINILLTMFEKSRSPCHNHRKFLSTPYRQMDHAHIHG
jgi:hypothetical protein